MSSFTSNLGHWSQYGGLAGLIGLSQKWLWDGVSALFFWTQCAGSSVIFADADPAKSVVYLHERGWIEFGDLIVFRTSYPVTALGLG